MTSIPQLAAEIERRAASKRDYIVNTAALAMNTEGELCFGDHEVEANDLAHSQIAQTLGIPKLYYDKMRSEAPALLSNNVNEWFAKYPADRMIRTLEGKGRAFLSAKYRRLENDDVAGAVLPIAHNLGLMPVRCDISDSRLYLKFVDKNITKEIPRFGDGSHEHFKTDVLHPAITVLNSEVGLGALAVTIGFFNDGCTNLTWIEKAVRKSHVGRKMEIASDFEVMLSDETQKLTDAALFAQVRDVFAGAFTQERFNLVTEKIAGAAKSQIGGDPVKVIELTASRFGLGGDIKTSMLKRFIEGGDLSQWGLSNAMTRAAQDVADVDVQNDMERFGGAIIELPANDWKELAMAA